MSQKARSIFGYFLLFYSLFLIYLFIIVDYTKFVNADYNYKFGFFINVITLIILSFHFIFDLSKRYVKDQEYNNKIQGWLIVFIIGFIAQFMFFPYSLSSLITNYFLNLNTLYLENVDILYFKFTNFQIIINIIIFILLLYIINNFFKKEKNTPILIIILYFLLLILNILNLFFVHQFNLSSDINSIKLIRDIATSAIWIIYFLDSKRVKSVFNVEKIELNNLKISKNTIAILIIVLIFGVCFLDNILLLLS